MTDINTILGTRACINGKIYYLSGFQIASGNEDHISLEFTPMHPAEWLDDGTNDALDAILE
mgnify:CR=1 FL=1